MFTAEDVKKLREMTGVGMMDCKKALTEANGNIDKAVELLREKGMAAAAKRAGRIASQGIIESYIHLGGQIGVLVEVNCETDFVARSDDFKEFVHNIAMQIAAAKPSYVSKDEVPAQEIEKEKSILKAQALNESAKPQNIIDKMVEGRINKYYKEVCLLEQSYVKDPDKSITQLLNETISKIGEKITIRRFARYEVGEGLEKRTDNFADEVMEQVNKLKK